ncbi:MAG: alpha/beta hydrolase [Stackebrandtia sp.]
MPKRRVRRTASVVLAVIVLLLAMAWIFQRELIYFPDTASPTTPATATEVTLDTSDGLSLAGWVFKPSGADRDSAVLLANGNGGNRSGRVTAAEALAAEGFTVLIFDYRGYGGNDGSPDEAGLYADAEAAYEYLSGPAGFDARRILFFGESLGCGVVSHLALEHRPAGMVLRSPFFTLPDVGQHHYPFLPVRMLLTEEYPVGTNVAKAKVPLTVVYATADSVVPARQSRQVADAAKDAGVEVDTVAVDGADHNDPALVHGDEVVAAVVRLADDRGLTVG